MPTIPTYPGVYIEEIPSGVRTIASVSTSITAFVGYLKRGADNEAVRIFSYGDFEREFGGLDRDCEVSYQVQQFFNNGGAEAYVIRVFGGTADSASCSILADDDSGDAVLTVEAINPGEWGNNLRVELDYETTDPTTLFNLTIAEYAVIDGRSVIVQSESFRNLTVADGQPNSADDVVNESSTLVRLTIEDDSKLPAPTGTTGSEDVSGLASGDLNDGDTFDVTLTDAEGATDTFSFTVPTPAPENVTELEAFLQSALSAEPELRSVKVNILSTGALHVSLGSASPYSLIEFADDTGSFIDTVGLNDGIANVQLYSLGPATATMADGTVVAYTEFVNGGSDGSAPTATEIIGSQNLKTGMYALEDVDLFNILCIPDTAGMSDATQAKQVMDVAVGYCEDKRAFYIVDIPSSANNLNGIQKWVNDNITPSKNSAVYFPRINLADPLNQFRLRNSPYSGTLAGLYSRTDSDEGVWVAAGGIDATLRGVQSFTYRLNDAENGVLNPLGINCLRQFPVYGRVAWGARTTVGADKQASEWKYIPVRRMTLFIEESLYRGLQWVVFEPNGEQLWSQIRLNVTAFMQNLFRQGAFAGTSPRDAYLVKCDAETTTATDQNLGIVNVVVAFAPLKPAEFVIVKISQLTGQTGA